MHLRWSVSAARDLEQIADYLFDKTPQHAPRLIRSLYRAVGSIGTFQKRGRPGKKAGTRELVVPALPYIAVYEVRSDFVYVVRILHGAQQWPD